MTLSIWVDTVSGNREDGGSADPASTDAVVDTVSIGPVTHCHPWPDGWQWHGQSDDIGAIPG